MYSSEICTPTLDLQDEKTSPQYLALLIAQYHAITKNRSHCMLPSSRENSWRSNNNILYHSHSCWGFAGLGEKAGKGKNPSAMKTILKRGSPSGTRHCSLHGTFVERIQKAGAGWGEGRLSLTQRQLQWNHTDPLCKPFNSVLLSCVGIRDSNSMAYHTTR